MAKRTCAVIKFLILYLLFEYKSILQYLNSIENTNGSIHESDTISQLIFDLISRIKNNIIKDENSNIASVLVIDDLDRLDSEHIFRLFNIFSAHYQDQLKNKFGFDKVIFVCDIENIRKIFNHRYGTGVDFAGYIDKFYSLLPFEFDNRQFIKNQIDDIIQQIKLTNNLSYLSFQTNNRFSDCVISIANSLIDSKALSLRMLLNYPQLKIPTLRFKRGKSTREAHDTPIVVLFFLLKNFYGSFDILDQKLRYLATMFHKNSLSSYNNRMSYDDSSYQIVISYCLPFILPEELAFKEIGDKDETITFSMKYKCFLRYNGFGNRYTAFKNFRRATETEEVDSIEVFLNPFEILVDTYEGIRQLGIMI